MNLALLLPAGLLALGALLVPMLLHLARRSEHRAIDFAAVRWLSARARPRRRLLLVEHGLLVLRLLLISALALLLAQPVWTGGVGNRAWTVVAPDVDLATNPKSSGADSERRWLAPGYPPLEGPRPISTAAVGSLLRELDARLPPASSLTVWVPRELTGLDGSSIELARAVRWRIAPGVAPLATTPGVLPWPFAVRLDPDREVALVYLRAAWQAWIHDPLAADTKRAEAQPLSDVALSPRVPRKPMGTLVWLRSGDLPLEVREWTFAGGSILIEPRTNWSFKSADTAVVWRDDEGTPLARAARFGRGRVVRLESPLDASAMPGLLDGSFAAALRELLHPRDVVSARVLAREIAPISNKAMVRSGVPMQRDVDIESWLAWLIAIGFVLERFSATSARRWRSA